MLSWRCKDRKLEQNEDCLKMPHHRHPEVASILGLICSCSVVVIVKEKNQNANKTIAPVLVPKQLNKGLSSDEPNSREEM